jgi:hypothetical protein
MLYEDEDDFFMGSPKSKFFDIVFHANQELVKNKLLEMIDRYSAMELLLEKHLGEAEAQKAVETLLYEDADAILNRNNDLFIAAVGEILTQNE